MNESLSISDSLLVSYNLYMLGGRLPWKWYFKDSFTICQTSFNRGLDFFITWDLWLNDSHRCARLNYVIIESKPLYKADLRKFWNNLPFNLVKYSDNLLEELSDYNGFGIHRFELSKSLVTLTIFIGNRELISSEIVAKVDIYFLYSLELLDISSFRKFMLNLSKLASSNAVLYTSNIDNVFLNIIDKSGFKVHTEDCNLSFLRRVVGYWKRSWSSNFNPIKYNKITIIGAGLSGVGIAHALNSRGSEVTVIDSDITGDSHIGHLGASVSPSISVDDNITSRLIRISLRHAWSRWSKILSYPFLDRCGSLKLYCQFKNNKIEDFIHNKLPLLESSYYVNREEGSDIAGIKISSPAVFCKDSILVSPRILINKILEFPGINLIRNIVASIKKEGRIFNLLDINNKLITKTDILIIANSYNSLNLLKSSNLDVNLNYLSKGSHIVGEVALIKSKYLNNNLNCIIEGDCYLLPARNKFCIFGGTYLKDFNDGRLIEESRLFNFLKLEKMILNCSLGKHYPEITYWKGSRFIFPNRLPIIGKIDSYDNLFLAIGYASRGLSWSALGGDIIASQIFGEPLLIEKRMMNILRPQ